MNFKIKFISIQILELKICPTHQVLLTHFGEPYLCRNSPKLSPMLCKVDEVSNEVIIDTKGFITTTIFVNMLRVHFVTQRPGFPHSYKTNRYTKPFFFFLIFTRNPESFKLLNAIIKDLLNFFGRFCQDLI